MSVAVYALTGAAGSRVTGRGLSGERLRTVRAGTVAAIVGDVARGPAPTEATLRAYTRLLAALAATRPSLLPVRFGTVVEDDGELETILRARGKALASRLARVRGRAQMTVRVVLDVPGVRRDVLRRDVRKVRLQADCAGPATARPHVRTGSEYLAARAREHSASAVPGFGPLNRAVARWVRDERVERRGTVVTVYHLIPRSAAARYAAALDAAAAAEGMRVLVSGPWPPHAFGDW